MRLSAKFHSLLLLVAMSFGITMQFVPTASFAYDRNTDRPGGDYTSSEVPGNDPRICASRCEIESQCLAWSYTLPGVPEPAARCTLKNVVTAPVAVNNVVSDVRPFEENTDRPGNDYTNFELPTANPAQCAARCSGDTQCQSWTYVRPGVQGALARCWLKDGTPPPIAAEFAVSGVLGYEYDTDRQGGDYTNFPLPQANPQLCFERCNGDSQCRAWTYVIPGVQGADAHCWLKSTVPASAAADFAISGVRGFEYDFDRPGGDYNDVALDAPDPQLCAARCASDSLCAAWTYRKPGATDDGLAHCTLKNTVPPQTPSVFAVSGLRPGAPQPPTAGQCPNPPNFAGRWNDPVSLGNVELAQTGNRVSGTYTGGDGGGTLDGTIEGCIWQGEWINNDNVRRGTFRVELSQDGQAFNGTWETTGAGGTINATR